MTTGRDRLLGWRDEVGVPPAVGRVGCRLAHVGEGTTTVELPLAAELLLPSGATSAAVPALLADVGLTTSVVSTLPDVRAVTTVSLALDLLGPVPAAGALALTCTATPFAGGAPQHARGTVHDDAGRAVAHVSGWLLPVEVPPRAGAARRGVPQEPPAEHLVDLLGWHGGQLTARDALSNVSGTLHGGVGALATVLAAEQALAAPDVLGEGARVLAAALTYERPTPRDARVALDARVLRAGRRTGSAEAVLRTAHGREALRTQVVAAVVGPSTATDR